MSQERAIPAAGGSAIIAELIARLEKAIGPDRSLDRDIHAYFCEHERGWTWKDIGKDASGENESRILVPPNMPASFTYPPKGKVHPHYHVPTTPLTGSIDEAVKGLVWPLHWQVGIFNLDNIPRAEIAQPVKTEFGPAMGVRAQAKGATPAIALCIAALKAAAAMIAQKPAQSQVSA